jgi:plastocyanin
LARRAANDAHFHSKNARRDPAAEEEKQMNLQSSVLKGRFRALGAPSLALAAVIAVAAPGTAFSDDEPQFTIEMKDGVITPDRLTVPAGKTVKITVKNTGSSPAEFESRRLRKERVISPGAETQVVLKGLPAGEYSFFDEFHSDAKPGVIIAE